MQILLTNDDGVEGPGMWALQRALQRLGRVEVVAPLSEQSGVGHAITYRTAVTARRVRFEHGAEACAVRGTPADCVKFGVLELLDQPPDLVASGINIGMNVGCNVFYSGTVAAALEGALYGIPSVAFSCGIHLGDRIDQVAEQARRALDLILQHEPAAALAWNVNVPDLPAEPAPLAFTRHWPRAFHERYVPEQLEGERGFRLHLPWEEQVPSEDGFDVSAVKAGKISVTPLRPSLTDHECLQLLESRRPPQSD